MNPLLFGEKVVEIKSKSELIKYNSKQHTENLSQVEVVVLDLIENDE